MSGIRSPTHRRLKMLKTRICSALRPLVVLYDKLAPMDSIQNEKDSQPPPLGFPERARAFWRCVGLQLVNQWAPWHRGTEKKKVAIYRDRWVALSHCVLHIPPLAGAITLIALNSSSYYIGGARFYWSTHLQFAAKLHEVWMQASLSVVLLSYIRKELLGSGMPFGTLFAPFHINNISYLWSLEYWSSITSSSLHGWRRAVFLLFASITIVLAALAGPSSAVAMIPRLVMNHNRPQYDFKIFLNALESPFPYHVNSSASLILNYDGLDAMASMGSYGIISSELPPKHRKYQFSRNETRCILSTFILQSDKECLGVVASFPSRLISNLLKETFELDYSNAVFQYPDPKYYIAESYQPITFARCIKHDYPRPLDRTTAIEFPSQLDGTASNTTLQLGLLFDNLTQRAPPESPELWNAMYPPFWLSPSPHTPNSILGIVGYIWMKNDTGNRTANPLARLKSDPTLWPEISTIFYACTVDAFWAPATYERETGDGMATLTASSSLSNWEDPSTLLQARRISIDPKWAEGIGHSIRKLTVLFSRTENIKDDTEQFVSVEEVLASSIANALSNLEIPGIVYNYYYDRSNGTGTTVTVKAFDEGQGYNLSETTTILALIVLSTYCIIIIIYLIYILSFGTVASSWDSAAEVAALALCSPRPNHLGPITAGIESLSMFREPVRIRANKEGELELNFLNDRERGGRVMRRVVRNREY